MSRFRPRVHGAIKTPPDRGQMSPTLAYKEEGIMPESYSLEGLHRFHPPPPTLYRQNAL